MFNFSALLMLFDVIAACISLAAGQYLHLGSLPDVSAQFGGHYLVIFIYSSIVLLSGFFCELYVADRNLTRAELAARLAVSIMIAFFVLSAIFYMVHEITLSRETLSLSLLILGGMQYLIRRACRSFQQLPHFAERVMILGVGPLAAKIEQALLLSPFNYQFAGFVQPANDKAAVAANRVVGTIDDIEEILAREKINKLIISMTEKRGVLPVRSLLSCKLRGVEILDSPSFYEKLTGKLLVEDIQPSWFIYSDGFRVTPFKRAWKRVLDIIFSSIGLLISLPIFPVMAGLIKFSSPGPVLYRQLRVGEGGCEFVLYKFRTMCDEAEKDTGAVWASENDPRITRLGRALRKTRIDEIPQLINVFIGEMSLIGPRPERHEFVEKLSERIPYYSKRHFIKPGVTGWAQVRYPYGASEKDALEKLRYDLYYIKNYSITLDLMIVLETVKVVLFGRGGR
jgi:sugar transferase (PEP-CTERM system associated)